MADFMARANLTLQGKTITVGEVAELDDDAEVEACVTQQLLIRRDADGTFHDPPPPPSVRCCGG